MPFRPATRDISGQMIFLGTGTSVGVPTIGCDCAVCTSDDPHNNRTRCSVILGLPEGNLLIDTPPDLRQQLLREGIGLVHAVVYTHAHADHLFGLDDLRLMQFYLGGPVPLYCEPPVEERIRKSYDYAFGNADHLHTGAVPKLKPFTIGLEPFEVLGALRDAREIGARTAQPGTGLSRRQRGLLHRYQRDPSSQHGPAARARRAGARLPAPRTARHAFRHGRGAGSGRRAGTPADVLHAHVAQSRLRDDQRTAARGSAAGA